MREKTFWWSEEALQILKERYVRDGPKKVAERLGTTHASVTCKAKRLGIRPKQETKPYEWTDEMLAALRELYPTETGPVLVERIGLPLYAIRDKARKLGIRNITGRTRQGQTKSARNTSCNIHFFDEWSAEMAYVLGFLYADGSITKRQCDVIIGLAIGDVCVLDHIKKVVKSTRKYDYREGYTDKEGHIHQKSVFLAIASKVLVQRLMEIGMMPRKTYRDDPFPTVPDDCIPHFIRGYFDGDGAAFRSDNRFFVKFIGTPKLITGIRDALVRLAGMSSNPVKIENSTKATNARVVWGAIEDQRKFRDFCYPPGYDFCLERKKQALDDWLAEFDTNNNG